MKIVWAKGMRSRLPASVVAKVMSTIQKEQGTISAPALVEAARPKSSPLHRAFDWDDRLAAERWRLQQAQQMIYSVRIISTPGGPMEPMFLNVGFGKGAMSTDEIRLRPEIAASVLEQAKRDLISWKNKYETVRDALSRVFEAVESIEKASSKRRKRVA